jgi:hypothetical protein
MRHCSHNVVPCARAIQNFAGRWKYEGNNSQNGTVVQPAAVIPSNPDIFALRRERPTAEGGCATCVLIVPKFIPRRRGLLYPNQARTGLPPQHAKTARVEDPGPSLRSTNKFSIVAISAILAIPRAFPLDDRPEPPTSFIWSKRPASEITLNSRLCVFTLPVSA